MGAAMETWIYDFLIFAGVGFFAQLIDGALGMGYGVISSTVLLATGVPLCGFRQLTGQPCPVCGGTHACAALAQGDLMVAWQANPGLMPLFVIAAAHAAQLAWEAWTGRRVTRWRIGPALWKAGGLFLIGSWALRLAGVL